MLQQHQATCLQSHNLDKATFVEASARQQQHEIIPALLPPTQQQRITFGPVETPRSEERHQQLSSLGRNNVALHSCSSTSQDRQQQQQRQHYDKANNTLTSKENGPNAQIAEEQQGLTTAITEPEPLSYGLPSKLLNMKAQILYKNPSLLTQEQLRNQLQPQQQQQQQHNVSNMLRQHLLQMPPEKGQQPQPQNDLIPKSIKESLDFNSRRRRGRLRSFGFAPYLKSYAAAAAAATTMTTTLSATSKGMAAKVNSKHEIVAEDKDEAAAVSAAGIGVQPYNARSNVPATFVAINKVAKPITTLLLTMLLSFLSITFVNKQKLVLSLNKIFKNNRKKDAATNINNNKNKNNHYNNSNRNTTKTTCSNRQQLRSATCAANTSSLSSLSTTTATSPSSSSSSSTPSPSPLSLLRSLWSSSTLSSLLPSSKLLYAFMFFSILIILPSNHHMVSAAKPKSATQLQQQQQQHNNHHKPNIAYAAGADNVHIDKEGMLLTPPSYQVVSSQTSNEMDDAGFLTESEELSFDDERQNLNIVDENDEGEEDDDEEGREHGSYERTDNNATHASDNATVVIKTPLFPKDLFTKEQLENGAVICHIMGVIYMFVALAIVCDEFFVPSLDVIIEKLGITDDVAGATFMAAGGSAPELFTSVIGVFVSFDDVGIGTIVGSAVFNILFVIGMCALFSRTVLSLTWWPLFRDCSFYSISLMVLIYFFRDNRIYWWEALILFSIYIAYVGFMKWNVQVESCVKRVITKNKGNAANSSETSMATQPGGSVTSRAASETRSGPPGSSSGAGTTGNSSGGNASTTQTGAKFRHGLLQLMIHTIDPLHDGKVDEKATQLHAIASLKVLLDATKPQRGGATTSAANHVKINLKETTLADRPNGNIDTTLDSPSLSGRRASWIDQRVKIQTRKFSIKQTQEIEDEPEPLSMAWPDTARKRLTYILVAPLLIPMWLTLPDTRTPKGKKLFPITFIGSIVWIAAFSYLMVWWANVAGDTAGIPPEVMGLTFLAAGTSIPDLITSVIVARKGFGDMAVSSSVGSNIFDVTVGLPIPWLLYGIFYGAPVEVNSNGMVCSITILFMMLIFVVMSIACFHWRMNKGLGFTMFLLYFVFVAVSLMFEYDVIVCPV